jgi:hypothetical protein
VVRLALVRAINQRAAQVVARVVCFKAQQV